ncbi:flagellar export chaperone FliS [Hydrogenophaga sp. NH-16]|uniref:flagellar export chaperone FliS n=1 Tax=Hydrogenophaga sp. NH-16 TaxID=2184519 RepID=UPI000FD8CBFF|nr:flagellar export chaperone FliS [Hydrogenophaga sp. NH-16]
MFTSVNSRAASAYKRVAADTGVQAADPHQLVGLLFEALMQSIHRARGAMAQGEVAAKGAAIGKAVCILEEGLKAGLNMAQGGELAQNLRSIYDYSILRLTQANLRNDPAALEEVSKLIEPVAQSWKLIGGPGPAYLQPVAGRGA